MNQKEKEEIEINRFKIFTDNREQLPFKFPNTIYGTLPCGDYTVEFEGKLYNNQIVIERKGGISEIYGATGSGRDRWERELEKLKSVEIKMVLCEFSYMDLVNKQPFGKLPSSAVYSSICSWQAQYNIPFIFCENRVNARGYLYKLFYEFTKHNILNLK